MHSNLQLQRVLVVDDDCVIRRSAARQLTKAGFLVSTAANGNEALTLLGREAYDAVLSDVRMPGMNGIELLELARGRFPTLPFIIMTGWVEDYITKAASKWGAAAVLEKPLLNSELMGTLKAAVSARILQAPTWNPALAENPAAGASGRGSQVVQDMKTAQQLSFNADSPFVKTSYETKSPRH